MKERLICAKEWFVDVVLVTWGPPMILVGLIVSLIWIGYEIGYSFGKSDGHVDGLRASTGTVTSLWAELDDALKESKNLRYQLSLHTMDYKKLDDARNEIVRLRGLLSVAYQGNDPDVFAPEGGLLGGAAMFSYQFPAGRIQRAEVAGPGDVRIQRVEH